MLGGQGWHGAKGGDVQIQVPGQHVLERTAVQVQANGNIEVRFLSEKGMDCKALVNVNILHF